MIVPHGPLTRYAKLRVSHAPGMPGTFSPPQPVSDPDMHHGTCVTHVRDAYRDGQLAVSYEVGGRENVPGIPSACATRKFAYPVRGPCCVLSGVVTIRLLIYKIRHVMPSIQIESFHRTSACIRG